MDQRDFEHEIAAGIVSHLTKAMYKAGEMGFQGRMSYIVYDTTVNARQSGIY